MARMFQRRPDGVWWLEYRDYLGRTWLEWAYEDQARSLELLRERLREEMRPEEEVVVEESK